MGYGWFSSHPTKQTYCLAIYCPRQPISGYTPLRLQALSAGAAAPHKGKYTYYIYFTDSYFIFLSLFRGF